MKFKKIASQKIQFDNAEKAETDSRGYVLVKSGYNISIQISPNDSTIILLPAEITSKQFIFSSYSLLSKFESVKIY